VPIPPYPAAMTPGAPPSRDLAARIHGPRDIRVGPEPVAARGDGEARLRVSAVGLCGSDLHWYAEAAIGATAIGRPLIPGHEFIGVIADGPRAGQRVVGDPADPCGRCDPCRAGAAHLCAIGRFAGHPDTDGALRSELPWPGRLLWPLRDTVEDDAAVLLEPLGIAIHAADLAGVRPGDRAGVFGCGPIGLVLLRLLVANEVTVAIATDRRAHRVEAARASGADGATVVDASASLPADVLPDPPLDVAFEASGDDGALEDAMRAVRPGGRVVIVGIPNGSRTTFIADLARRKELAIVLCRRMQGADLGRAIDLVAAGTIDLGGLVTDSYPLTEAADAFRRLETRDGLKVVIRP
jgi:L-iditol 2-dehydrogenase